LEKEVGKSESVFLRKMESWKKKLESWKVGK
jgi:hypothetical protein